MTGRILLIDDDADIRETLETTLTDAGFLDQAFDTTGDVFQTFELHQPDLILVDYLLKSTCTSCCHWKLTIAMNLGRSHLIWSILIKRIRYHLYQSKKQLTVGYPQKK